MTPGTILLLIHVGGVLFLAAGLIAFLRNRRRPTPVILRVTVAIVSALLVGLSFQFSYPLGDAHRIVGFPFMAAIFQRDGDRWTDFLGAMTYPAFVGNCLFALALPQVALFIWRTHARHGAQS
jgi:hypothetical protein